MSTLELTVDGMTCGGCTSRLKRLLEGAEGVKSTHIVLDTGQVSVDFDASRIGVDAIESVISDAGFTVRAA